MNFVAAVALAPLWNPSHGYQLPFISWPQRRKNFCPIDCAACARFRINVSWVR